MTGKVKRETLGEHVSRLRNERGITLRSLARLVGISAPFMSDLEHDRRRPSKETLAKIATVLGAPLSALARHSISRDRLALINRDPELVELLQRVMSDQHCRRLVLRALPTKPGRKGKGK